MLSSAAFLATGAAIGAFAPSASARRAAPAVGGFVGGMALAETAAAPQRAPRPPRQPRRAPAAVGGARAAGLARGAARALAGAVSAAAAAVSTKRQKHWEGLLASSLAPMLAVCVTNPAEVTKVRLQMYGELQRQGKMSGPKPTYLGTLARTLRTQGIEGLQAGLSIAIVREGTKNIFRIGCYDPILAQIHPDEDPKSAPVWKRLVAGATSGTVAAVSCNPVDIVKTRMQGKGAGARALAGRGNYSSVFEAIRMLPRDEGVRGAYAGAEASAMRSSINTAVNLTTYTTVKEFLVSSKLLGAWEETSSVVHLSSALASATAGCAVTHPLDVMRTRLYMQPKDAQGNGKLYKGLIDCAQQVARKEGLRGFYKGFQAHFMRIGPHLVLTFYMLEQFKGGLRQWEPFREWV